jgi:hypothetical protein
MGFGAEGKKKLNAEGAEVGACLRSLGSEVAAKSPLHTVGATHRGRRGTSETNAHLDAYLG